MSNRFHSKYHRKNHHTYGNPTNPDASHDPIASPDQPFLGDFSLQGALCAVAPASAYAGYFYSNNTALCAFGNGRGIFVTSPNLGIASYSLNTPLSTAFGKNILHGVVGINKNAVTFGYVLDVLGNTNLDGNLNVVGDVDIDGGDLTASTTTFNLVNATVTTVNFAGAATTVEIGASSGTTNINNNLDVDGDVNIDGGDLTASTGTFNLLNASPTTTINFGGNADTINIGNDTTSTVNINGDNNSTSCTTGALVVDGGVGIGKDLNVCGQMKLANTTGSTTCATGALTINGGVGISENLNVCGNSSIGTSLSVGTTLTVNSTDNSTSCSNGALIIKGGVGIAKDLNVCGNLRVNGELTYMDTTVTVTSAMQISNTGTGPALKVTQYGTQPIAHFIDANGDDIVFNDNGHVGIATDTPETKLQINFDGQSDFGVALRLYQNQIGNSDGPKIEFTKYMTSTKKWTAGILNGADVGSFAISEDASYEAFGTPRFTILAGGNIGIGKNPSDKLDVDGRIIATGTRVNQGAPSNSDSSTNGYAFADDGDTGMFSPIVNGGAANGIVSLYSNSTEKLRVDANNITIYEDLIVTGTIINDPKLPVTTASNYSVTQNDHDKTILANSANSITISLPSGLKSGTQVSVIRVGTGSVQFIKGTGMPGLSSAPTDSFNKLAFQNSAASAYWTGSTWYLVGDLLT
jgi:hypothetical protein